MSANDDRQSYEDMRVAEKYAHKLIRTIHVRVADAPGKLGDVAHAIGEFDALVGDVRKVAIDSHTITRDVTVYVDDLEHLDRITARLRELEGIEVLGVSDDVLELHEGGKLRVASRTRVDSLLDLQKVYTPGVADVSRTIARDENAFRRYTWAGDTVAIISDGSAILGLGDLGPKAALPVLEGKAVILDQLAGVGCVPLLLSTRDVDRAVETIEAIAGGFGVIMLEDIAAPRCFEIEARLRERLDVPVFHDDQHGTAVVVLAAVTSACARAGADLSSLCVVVSGAGAAGTAVTRLLLASGVRDAICCDRAGAIHVGRSEHMTPAKEDLARVTNRDRAAGTLAEVLAGREVFVGLSSPGLVTPEMVSSMAPPRFVLAMANPDPEILPAQAVAAGAGVAVDGRVVNNALAFPGIIRGALDVGASAITDEMNVAAAKAIAGAATAGVLLPSILDPDVHRAVARAVAEAWRAS